MSRLYKPKVLADIIPRGRGVHRNVAPRLNLSYRRLIRIPLSRVLVYIITAGAFFSLLGGSASAPTITSQTLAASDTATTLEERRALEAELQGLERQIDQYENQILSYQKQGKTLKNQIAQFNDKIAKLNLQIRAVTLSLGQLDHKIRETESQISITEEDIATNRSAIGSLVRDIYENDQASLIEIFLQKPRLSDFFNDINSAVLLQSNLRATLNQIENLHEQLTDQRDQLSLARADASTIKSYQLAQKQETEKAKGEKNSLLSETKGQESKYQTLLKQTKESAAKIRSRIFQLLGGGELTFEQAYQYAKLASQATGVRAALILAVLDRESALGQNVGRCSFRTAMSPKNQELFLQLTKELGINSETMTVSCPNADGVYGGAMGPAQFIPTTWMLYRDAVSKITGNTPASPWNNADAFVATALYLKDAGAASATIAEERIAAAKYYAGSRWRRHLWTYGEAVVSRAIKFQEDINTIAG